MRKTISCPNRSNIDTSNKSQALENCCKTSETDVTDGRKCNRSDNTDEPLLHESLAILFSCLFTEIISLRSYVNDNAENAEKYDSKQSLQCDHSPCNKEFQYLFEYKSKKEIIKLLSENLFSRNKELKEEFPGKTKYFV